jgi:cytochrome b pre-mRNA-processing protein 3
MKDMANRYSISAQQHRIKLANHLFRAAQRQALSPEWYGTSQTPNKIQPNFKPQHAMLSLHVWFIHKRLLAYDSDEDKESGKHGYNLMIQEELFEMFWNDTMARIRSSGVNELTVNKHLANAQQATFLHCTQYDHAFAEFKDDPIKRFEVICDAVWRHILGSKDDVDDELIRKLGAYVEYQLDNVVYKLPDDYFEEGRIGWGNIPDLELTSSSSGDTYAGSQDEEKDDNAENVKTDESGEETTNALSGMTSLGNDWMQVLTDAGKPYYWNTSSNRTSWQRPV